MSYTLTKAKPSVATPHYSGHRKRLRQRFLQSTKGCLPDYEILEILLFAGHAQKDVKPLAKQLIEHFGSLAEVFQASPSQLLALPGINEAAAAQLRVVQEAAERLLKHDLTTKPILQSWKSLLDYCRASMSHSKKELFRVLYLNNQNRLIADELQEHGTIDQIAIYPREITKRGLELEAASIILVHNHPSGNSTPSTADIALTKQINHALEIVGIHLHDHVIIGKEQPYSFKHHAIL